MDLKRVYSKVFLWMFIGLLVTFITGYIVSVNENMLLAIYKKGFYWIFAIAEIILVIVLSARIRKMSTVTARICFILYSFVSGLTFSSIFVAYNISYIMYVFVIAAVLFAIFAAIGHFTKLDLSKLGTILFMALIGIIICSIVNLFVKSEGFNLGIVIASLVIFLLYVAYDIKKISSLQNFIDNEDNLAICGALELYLDFINIFINLLRLLGNNRDS